MYPDPFRHVKMLTVRTQPHNRSSEAKAAEYDLEKMNEMVEFVVTPRGTTILTIGRYRYSMKQIRGLKKHWLCSSSKSKACKAVVHTIDDIIVYKANKHRH
ncbi:hypothetical protein EVAR_17894_1 [Eumeta japonica]|uniref:FLYWCH-type domain-containing protein n=1 Tax=Eumeta variegata TaxID=151549 RepID=A0A4C1UZF5_EUMVA|nr:hypothetical protein EVAR_17894_1 [Eumeta japonica]